MKVFKFGGASVNSIERIKIVGEILKAHRGDQLLIVISAMGKTTNALEKVTEAFFDGRQEEALKLFDIIKQQHLTTAKYLLVTQYLACESQLKDFFTEVEWLLHDKPVRSYDYYYDQVVCAGELLSTAIVAHFLIEIGLPTTWLDVRDIIRTDNNFRDAIIHWEYTSQKVRSIIVPMMKDQFVLTQGFIGATDENESTTLGREGSDYTAAVFTNMLHAESLTIWKDVESVMNADPKQFNDAQPLHELSYSEVVEMAYYGAQVIHPKTIKPLQNKDIPLLVKCFLNPDLPGTVIHHQQVPNLPPIYVRKDNQVMLEMRSTDFSFIGEHHVGQIYQLFEKIKVKPNLTQNGAISLTCVVDDYADKLQEFALEASSFVDVQVRKGLTLLTIRHYNEAQVTKLLEGKTVLLRQQTPDTIQLLID